MFINFSGLFHYHFMQNAFIAGTIIAILAGTVGYFMVVRRQSFAGHSLANVGFAGATGASLIGLAPLLGLFVSGVLAAFGIYWLGLDTRHSRQSDIATGAIFSASMGLGFLFVHLSTAQANNVYYILFGNVLGISDINVLVTAAMAIPALALVLVAARPLLFASVDPVVAEARGVPVGKLGLGFLLILALVVTVAVQVVGVLLIFALLVTPAATARRLSTRPMVEIIISVVLALIFTWAGLVAGYYTSFPVSFFITSFAFGFYVLVRVTKSLGRMRNISSNQRDLGGSGADGS